MFKLPIIIFSISTLAILSLRARALEVLAQAGIKVESIAIESMKRPFERLIPGDEIDALEAQLKPPERFEDYRPQWQVELRSFRFEHYNRIEERTFPVVLDGSKVVAFLRSGDIVLLAQNPERAREALKLPTERLHLDNLPGASLPTWPFIKNIKTHGSIYEELGEQAIPLEHWETDGQALVYIRRQRLPEYRIEARFIFTVDPIYGYRIDAVRNLEFTAVVPPDKYSLGMGTFTSGCYPPWDKDIVYARTVYTPGSGGIKGWANNLLCMDRCDADKKNFDLRDNGFVAYLTQADGWGTCFTRKDGAGKTASLSVCNAHNDFHIKLFVPPVEKSGDVYPYYYVHRLMALPPEFSTYIWDKMELLGQGQYGLVVKIGKLEDFEKQPVALTEPARGLVWTSGAPAIVKGDARSGERSIRIDGRSWPNLPQISLLPGVRYRLEGWFKLSAWTEAELKRQQERDRALREKLTKEGKPLPPEIKWETLKPTAYIEGDLYEWSPHVGPMLVKQTTTKATRTDGSWEQVTLEFESPKWGPFVNIAFVTENGTALLDDFALLEIE